MRPEQIALTLYTLRDHCQDVSSLKSTLRKVKEVGYPAIQISGVGVQDPKIIRDLVDEAGLVICATHESSKNLLEEPEGVVERLNILGCQHTAFPHPGPYPIDSVEACLQLASQLEHTGKILRAGGKQLSYHNHELEFVRYGNHSIMELILSNTDPKFLQAELDTFWIQKGGENPVEWCRKMKGRLPLLHLKDYVVTLESEILFGEVGTGSLNWDDIIREADVAGCEWFIVEQDKSTRDAFESIKLSFDFLMKKAEASRE
jgi:sugar phosphate isomerase/epimerase